MGEIGDGPPIRFRVRGTSKKKPIERTERRGAKESVHEVTTRQGEEYRSPDHTVYNSTRLCVSSLAQVCPTMRGKWTDVWLFPLGVSSHDTVAVATTIARMRNSSEPDMMATALRRGGWREGCCLMSSGARREGVEIILVPAGNFPGLHPQGSCLRHQRRYKQIAKDQTRAWAL